MVLTITVVGNGQGQNGASQGGHAVLSPNELAQLMSGQTVTGLLNPDGSITLNSNVVPTQQMTSIPTSMQNGSSPITSSAGTNYQPQLPSPSSNSISNMSAISSNINTPSANNNHSQPTTNQKKTAQKRLSAKQKLAQQQQQLQQQQQQQQHQQQIQQQQQQQHQIQQQKMQQMPSPDTRTIMAAPSEQTQISQQPQIVATVQLPNGQIGQLIAPSGGQFWSPNAINLQQLSMAVAAATGTMPQAMSIPGSSNQPSQQIGNPNMQQAQQQHHQQQQQHSMQASNQMQQNSQQPQPQSQQPQSMTDSNQNQVVTAVSMPNSHNGQVINRQNQGQIWSGGPISLSQLSALAQQGVVQLSPMQGIPSTGPNGQRVMEMIPQAAIQGLLSQNGQPVQAIPLSSGGQYITQDPSDPNKWQIIQPNQVAGQQTTIQAPSSNNEANNETPNQSMRGSSSTFNSVVNTSSQNNVSVESGQSTQPQRKLKRLACTCPNCRDGDNNRNNGDKKKQHICHFPDCNKVYGKTSHLRAHLRWHSGERPYVCNWSFCGKKFTRSDELQRHRRTHTGEKRFQCSECLKRFMRSDHLSKHLKTHLSSKKGGTSQPQTNGMPTLVTLPHNQAKLEHNMIDELADESQDDANRQQTGHENMNMKLSVNDPS